MIKTRIGGAAALLTFGFAAVAGAPVAFAATGHAHHSPSGDAHTGSSVSTPRLGQEVVPRSGVIPRHGDDGDIGASHPGLGDAWTDHWRQITREREIGHR